MNNRCVCWYWHGLVQSGTKLCRYMAYLLAVMIKGMSSPPQRPPAAVAHNGRSSSGCGLSVHGHPGRDRPPAVPWSPATDLPLWPPLLEEAVHPLQGEPASNLPHNIIHKPGGGDCVRLSLWRCTLCLIWSVSVRKRLNKAVSLYKQDLHLKAGVHNKKIMSRHVIWLCPGLRLYRHKRATRIQHWCASTLVLSLSASLLYFFR